MTQDHIKPRWVENVDSLNGVPISATAPTTGQALVFNGTKWAPGAGGGAAPSHASTSVEGIVYMSTAPAVSTHPTAVGDNDTRLTGAPFLSLASGGTVAGGTAFSAGISASDIVDSALTSGRVPVVSTSGLLIDSPRFLWASNLLTVGDASTATRALFQGATAGTGTNVFKITGTMPNTSSAETLINEDLFAAGTGTAAKQAHVMVLHSGYAGSGPVLALKISNNAVSTGTTLKLSTTNTFPNVATGAYSSSISNSASTTNIGALGVAENGGVNLGVIGKSVSSVNATKNIGVVGAAANGSSINVGGIFQISGPDEPTFTSAALIADNGTSSSPILLARANGTTILSIDSVGAVSSSSTASFSGITDTSLTSGRVPYASTGGLLVDSANLTFDGSNLHAVTMDAFTVTATNLRTVQEVTGIYDGSDRADIRFSASGTPIVTVRSYTGAPCTLNVSGPIVCSSDAGIAIQNGNGTPVEGVKTRVISATTTDATATELTVNGTSLTLADNTVHSYTAHITVRCTGGAGGNTGKAAYFRVEVLAKAAAGAASIVGSDTITELANERSGTWAVSTAVSSNKLQFMFTGGTTDNVTVTGWVEETTVA